MINFFHRIAAGLMACLLLLDPGTATAFCRPETRPAHLPACTQAFGEQAVVAGLTDWIQSLDVPAHLFTIKTEGAALGFMGLWKPVIPRLQEKGWSDTRIAGILGGSEEFLFSGVLVSLGSLLLTHVFGISFGHALEITSFISGILFPLTHWKERFRLVGGQLTLAPPNDKRKDLLVLAAIGAVLRLAYALPLAHLPFGHSNILAALPIAILGHSLYNVYAAPGMGTALGVFARDLLPPEPGEIVITRDDLKPLFHMNAQTEAPRAAKLIDEAAGEAHQVQYGGILFKRRATGRHNHVMWVFDQADSMKVGKVFNWPVKSEMRRLENEDIPVTVKGLTAHFIGDQLAASAQVNELLSIHPETENEAELQGIRFYRRLAGKRRIWAFSATDAIRAAQAFGWKARAEIQLEFLASDEIPATVSGLESVFIGNPLHHVRQLNSVLDQNAGDAKEIRYEGVLYHRRLGTRAHTVWAFNRVDRKEVERTMNWTLREGEEGIQRQGSSDIKVTENDLQTVFVGNPGPMATELRADLDIAAGGLQEVVLQGISFVRKMSGHRRVWTFDRKDKAVVAGARQWVLRAEGEVLEQVQPDEIGVSVTGMPEHYFGITSEQIAACGKTLTDSAAGASEILYDDVLYRRRFSGTRRVWTFEQHNKEAVAMTFGLRLRQPRPNLDPIQPGETPVSTGQFKTLFSGDTFPKTRLLKRALEQAAGDAATAVFGGVPFVRRLRVNQPVWTFPTSRKNDVAAHFNWRLRQANYEDIQELQAGEIGISESGFNRYFTTHSWLRTREINEHLDAVSKESLEVNERGIPFVKRRSGSHVVWAFPEEYIPEMAAAYGFTLRTDPGEMIEALGLEEAIALLHDDPLRLKQYIQLYHPELSPDDVDAIAVTGAMHGLRGDVQDKEELHQDYEVTLAAPAIMADLPEHSTESHAFKLSGQTVPGVRYIQVIGAYTRRIVVRHDGTFSATLPIPRTGESNQYFFYAVKDDAQERGEAFELTIQQTGTKEGTEGAFLRLLALKEEVLEAVKINPARYHFLLHAVEQSLLKQFTYSEDQGFDYLKRRIRQEQSKVLQEMLRAVETEFRQIAAMPLHIRPSQRLYFFQKYTVYQVNHLLTDADPATGRVAQGVIIANEQGLGKTVTALVIINGKEAVIITPNSVVSTWAEQEEKFLPEARMEILEGSYAERLAALATLSRPQVVTNVEFTQGMTEERAAALSNKAEILVVDEADYLSHLASQQSKGTRMIQSTFRLLLTATPFKKISHIGNLLGFLYPNDSRFNSSRKTFTRAFPADNPESLNALFLLMQRHTIRIRKRDVFEEYDRAVPLTQQSDRLPKKVEVDPARMGRFSLLKEQCDSIRQLFTDYQAWCQAHRVWVEEAGATPEDKKYKRFNEGFFPKLQALRQIMNNPAYFGQPGLESPKHLEMDRIVHHELDGKQNADHKVIIFCKYVAEVEAYLKRFESYGAIGHYGELPRDSNGYKINAEKNREYFEADPYENFVLRDGRPIKTTRDKGRPIRVLDYQRLLFQNDPRSRVLVATYDTGSVGVTLTGAHAVIDDDLAPTYRDQYQSDDRAHRIDNDRKKYEVRYYRLLATYPESWLKSLDPELLHDYFEMGTYDQVQFDNLRIQARIFHRIMDGVGDENELIDIRRRFLASRMPFLFKGPDAQDTEDATAPEILEGQDAVVEAEAAGEVDEEGESQGLLSIWKPLIPWLQENGWSDTRIAAILGGTEEFLFSGVLVSLGSFLLTHVLGISLPHAIEITSLISGILFPLTHWKQRYRLVGGQLTLAPPNEKRKDLLTLAVLGAALRLAYALPLAHLPFGQWNILAALPIAILGHGFYNAWLASRLKTSLAMALLPLQPGEIPLTREGLFDTFIGERAFALRPFQTSLGRAAGQADKVELGGVRFFRRVVDEVILWAFHESDKEVFAKQQGWRIRKKDLEPPSAEEVSVIILELADLFSGPAEEHVRHLNDVLENASGGGDEAALGGVLYARRQGRKDQIWAFARRHTQDVAAHFGWKLRESGGTPAALDANEIPVTQRGIAQNFICDAGPQTKALQEEIEKHRSGNNEISLNGVRYFRRMAGTRLVWAFGASDSVLLAAQRGWGLKQALTTLQEVQPGEIAITQKGFAPVFIGNNLKQSQSFSRDIITAAGTRNEVDLDGIHYILRRQKNQSVWVFSHGDVSAVAQGRNWALRQSAAQLQKPTTDEVIVANPAFRELFINVQARRIKELNRDLDRLAEQKVEVDHQGITYRRRLHAKVPVWVFERKDLAQFASQEDWKLQTAKALLPLQPDEIPVSVEAFAPLIVGEPGRLVKDLQGSLGAVPAEVNEIERDGIRYVRRRSGPRYVWAFQESDLPRLTALKHWTLRSVEGALDELHLDEAAVTKSSLTTYVVGDLTDLARQLNDSISAAAGKAEQVDYDGIRYVRRLKSNHRVWAFPLASLPVLAAKVGKSLRPASADFPELGPDETAVIIENVRQLFVGSAPILAARLRTALNARWAEGTQSHGEVVINGARFFQRSGRHTVQWAFASADLDLVARAFGLTTRTGADLLVEQLGLEEAISLLGDDPLRLKQYIQLYHPELSPEDVDAIAVAGAMRGLRGDVQDKDELHKGYEVTLPVPAVVTDLPEHSTAGHAFKLSGKTEPGVRYIQVIGAYTRRIVVRQDGTFGATLPVPRTGDANRYFFYPVKDDTKERGEAFELTILQTGTKEDTEAAFLRLLALKEEMLESIKVNPARYYFLLHSIEQSLLRHFTYGEDQGFAYLKERIRREQSMVLKEILRAVETEFRQIAGMRLNIRANQRLYFFQKYTAYKANHLLIEPDPVTGQVAQGVIIANEQGLGKTVTALVIVNGKEAVIITPNSVVSTWAEQEEKFMPQARMEILEGSYAERQAALQSLTRPQVATNVEFTQGMTEERAAALSNKAEILVVDEADYLGRLASQQSKGTRMIKSVFRLLLTATPFKKISHIGNLLGFLYPNDPRFGSTKAFARAFPADDPESLNALFLLMQRHTIRVRKKDVFEEYDPAKPLSQQSDRLPRKVEVDPAQMGRFSLLKEQCESIAQLFTDYQAWCQAHRVWVEQAGATTEDKKYKRFKEGFFPKLQALRQIMNDPAYFGSPQLESPKHLEMDRIVHHELDGNQNADHKVIIFCKYVAEVEAYLKRFESYGALGYYGDLPRDKNGYKIDAGKNREYYEVDEYDNFVLKDGKPVATSKATGHPIRALDYQRILFQNDPKSRILVSTYETGSVGVTLTGAHAVIDDDLAPTYRDQYQADDRAHRIDNDRKKYEVRYYRLQAIYPKDWLDSLDPDDLHDYFEMGTYDQVQFDNLRIQSRIFHRIMDGVGDESELVGIRHRFLANRMPFLFKGTDAQDTEDATAPEVIEGKDAGVEAESAGEVDDEGGSQGLLSMWKPLIPWLQERGWSDTRIAGVLGGSEEFLFSGVLVSLGSLLLTHIFGISLTHALEITSFISGILFPLSHWKERYRLVGGQLTLAPPTEKKKDLLTLAILATALRLLYALPLAGLPFGHWNTLIALPLTFIGHAAYNGWIAPRLRASVATVFSAQLAKAV